MVHRSHLANCEAIETAMVGTRLLGVRFATHIRSVPLLLILYAAGTVDGPTERRTQSCPRRSAGRVGRVGIRPRPGCGGYLTFPTDRMYIGAATKLALMRRHYRPGAMS